MYKKYDKAYVICLEENSDRMSKFFKDWNNVKEFKEIHNQVELFKAIDTRNDLWEKYIDHLSKKALKELLQTIKTKYRKEHYCLSPGAIGCYLSHVECWKKFLNERKGNYCLIMEDDCSVPPNLMQKINKITHNMNDKWGVILLGWKATSKYEDFNKDLYKVNTFNGTYCYLLSVFGAKKLLNEHKKIEKQVDFFMSDNNEKAKLFGTIDDICIQANHCNYSTIQVYPVKAKEKK